MGLYWIKKNKIKISASKLLEFLLELRWWGQQIPIPTDCWTLKRGAYMWCEVGFFETKAPPPPVLTLWSSCVSAGTLYSGVQVQRVRVWELLRDLLVHVVQTTGVGESLVPRAQQRRSGHEGEPSEENQTSCSLPAQAIRRYVPHRTAARFMNTDIDPFSIFSTSFIGQMLLLLPDGLSLIFLLPRSSQINTCMFIHRRK